jgi:hypothetical protein
VSRSISQLIKREPAVGWIRGDSVDTDQRLALLEANGELQRLRRQLNTISGNSISDSLAGGADEFELEFYCDLQTQKFDKNGKSYWVATESVWKTVLLTWDSLLSILGIDLITSPTQSDILEKINSHFFDVIESDLSQEDALKLLRVRLGRDCGRQIITQFSALGLIEIVIDKSKVLLKPTDLGISKIYSLVALKKGEQRARSV